MKLRLFVFLGVLTSVCLAVSVNDCPASLPRNQYLRTFGDRCYQFELHHKREFNPAERECRARGGHLVVIRDLATQQFLYNTLRQGFHYHGTVWIGLSDQESEGHFVWVDGSPAQFTYWTSDTHGQHNGDVDDCVVMDVSRGGIWHDQTCSDVWGFSNQQTRFICEFQLVSQTTPVITTPPTTHHPVTPPSSYQPPYHPSPTLQPPYHPTPTHQPPHHPLPTHQPPYHPTHTHQPPYHPSPTHQPPHHPSPTHQPPYHPSPTHQPTHHPPPTHQPPYHRSPTHQPPYHQSPTHQPPHHPTPTHQLPYHPTPTYQPSYQPTPYHPTPTHQPPYHPTRYQPPYSY
ncbi:uncharacterized protein LOC143287625 [Babylonia areolata]|uniref:uncharacterized protein LOC143287625 n=1 Tax=Babylonia areolata TaxID=304850 RepID=UPI003FCF914D